MKKNPFNIKEQMFPIISIVMLLWGVFQLYIGLSQGKGDETFAGLLATVASIPIFFLKYFIKDKNKIN